MGNGNQNQGIAFERGIHRGVSRCQAVGVLIGVGDDVQDLFGPSIFGGHIGGAVQDQPMASSLYRGREAEWSIVVTSVWDPGDVMGEKTARNWADEVFDQLEPLACHVYLVERHPEGKRFKRELELAYGPDLELLRRLKDEWDPDKILPSLNGPCEL